MNAPRDADTPLTPASEQLLRDLTSGNLGPDEYDEIAARLWLIESQTPATLDATRAAPDDGEQAAREFIESIPAFRPVDAELVNATLAELQESPLPGARYAYEVVKRRFAAALSQPAATAGIDVDLAARLWHDAGHGQHGSPGADATDKSGWTASHEYDVCPHKDHWRNKAVRFAAAYDAARLAASGKEEREP